LPEALSAKSWLVMIASFSEGGPQPHTSWLRAIHVGGLWLPLCSGAKVVVRGYTTISEKKESVTSET
jgi:hypothetical protein